MAIYRYPNGVDTDCTSSLVPGESQDVDVAGIAYSGGGRGIVRVDVSGDQGKTWVAAELGEVTLGPSHTDAASLNQRFGVRAQTSIRVGHGHGHSGVPQFL